MEEPGGQRALIFVQGNRITQQISCADVADVVLKVGPARRCLLTQTACMCMVEFGDAR